MNYFKDREEAGKLLAERLATYDRENCAVLSLSEGGVLVGAEIAKKLHTSLFSLAIENINLPGELDPVAMMSSAGTFTYNNMFSAGQLEEINNDYRPIIEQERLQTFQRLNRVIGKDGLIDKDLLKRHVVIIVSDGFKNGLSLDVAADFLKSINVKKLIVATPIAHVQAVDRMHILADEIFCLGVTDNYINTEHYYENNEIPDHETVVEMIKNIVLNW